MAYQIINMFAFFFNCWGRFLPRIATFTLWFSLMSFFIILVTVPATATTHQSPRFVFATFVNNTGWASGGIAFIVGLVNTNWAFACKFCITLLCRRERRNKYSIMIDLNGPLHLSRRLQINPSSHSNLLLRLNPPSQSSTS